MGGCIRRIHFEDCVKTNLNQRAKYRVPRVNEFSGYTSSCYSSFDVISTIHVFTPSFSFLGSTELQGCDRITYENADA